LGLLRQASERIRDIAVMLAPRLMVDVCHTGLGPRSTLNLPNIGLRASVPHEIPARVTWSGGRLIVIAACRGGGFQLRQMRRGVDDRGVREGLWKIAEQSFRDRIVFFGEQAEVVAEIEQPLE
jgi:hypothetical protein